MGKKSRRDAQQLEKDQAALAVSKAAEAKAAKRAAATRTAVEVVPPAEPTTQNLVAEPATENVEVKVEKPKKARFVREKVAKKAPVKDAPLPARNTTAAGKMMTRNVMLRPEDEQSSGPKDDRATGPKPKSKS